MKQLITVLNHSPNGRAKSESQTCMRTKSRDDRFRADGFVDESNGPQDWSAKMKWGVRTPKQGPEHTKENVLVRITNEESKKMSITMRSEENPAQGVKNCAKIVIENEKNNESTTIHNDRRSRTPLAEV